MDAILQTLQELDGVNGAVVADSGGQILAYRAHAVYDPNLLQQVSRVVVTAIDSVKLLHEDWESVTVQFAEGKLLIRSLSAGSRGKTPDLTLSVIADMRLNLSFASVAIRVALAKLKALIDAGLSSPALMMPNAAPARLAAVGAIPSPLPPTGRASVPGIPAMSAPQARPMGTDPSASSLNWSGFGASSPLSGSGIAAVDAASSATLAGCTKALARSVGPMAKRYVKESLSRICPDRPFSRELTPALVAELEKYLQDPAEAAEFRKLALKA